MADSYQELIIKRSAILIVRNKETVAQIIRWPIPKNGLSLAVRLLVARHRTGVGVVGFGESGRILMLRHVFHPHSRWGLPGGWLERGEDPADCAVRELKEETGLNMTLGPVVYLARQRSPAHIGIAYAVDVWPGQVRLSAEILEAGWFAPEEMPEPLLPFARASIGAAIDSKLTPTSERVII